MITLGRRQVYFAPGDDIITPLCAALAGAQHTIHGCLYVLTLPEVVDAITQAMARGCVAALVLDASEAAPLQATLGAVMPALEDLPLGGSTETAQIARLRTAGVGLAIGNSPMGSLIHSKYVVLDKRYVIWGSTNFTRSGMTYQCNQTSFEPNARLAAAFEADFQSNFDRISKGGTPS